jgi:hypothetical protein
MESDATVKRKSPFSQTSGAHTEEASSVIEEIVRMAVTWGVMCGLVAFFYWMMSNIGTF